MELTREHFRSIIFALCIDELEFLFGDYAPSYSIVKNWFNEFNCGRRSLKDEVREGPTKTAVVPENIDAWTNNARSACEISWERGILINNLG